MNTAWPALQPAEQSDRAVLRLVRAHPGGEPGAFRIRFVLGCDDRFRADQELREQSNPEVLGGDCRQHRPFRLVEGLVE